MSGNHSYHAAVIGGGLVGLAAAWHFRRLGPARVILVERFERGHARGSSHGRSRITRSAYGDPAYVDLMRAARRDEWTRLERACGRPLIHPTPACFFGRGSLFETFASTMRDFPDEVDVLPASRASTAFPALRLEGMDGAIVDRTAGVIAAERTLQALEELCESDGVEFRERTRVLSVEPETDAIRVRTDHGDILARHVLVAAGAWIGDLVPVLAPRLTVLRQTVAYVRLRGGPEAMQPGRFPVWGYLGEGANDFYYGLPQFEQEGVKIARHVTAGPAEDPEVPAGPGADALSDLRSFAAKTFTAAVEDVVGSETCLYTCTPDEHFIIDRHPEDARIAFASACSGHGFKFGPLTGRILAETALLGRTSVPEFEQHRATFSLARHAADPPGYAG